MAGRSVRRFISDLGYAVHTPASVFGRARLEKGLDDADWLPVAGRNGWVVVGRDHHILDRQWELNAYLKAKVHMFLLPGQATRDEILALLTHNLAAVCASAMAREPSVYWLTSTGLVGYEQRLARRAQRRNRR